MQPKLIKHGSEAGYREELKSGTPCDRCVKGHRVFARQYRPSGKAAGLRYAKNDALDHLYPGSGRDRDRDGTRREKTRTAPAGSPPGPSGNAPREQDGTGPAARLAAILAGPSPAAPDGEYVPGDPPPYLTSVEPDPEPDGSGYPPEPEAEYVLNQAGLEKIQENLGTYLSVVGMTAEMIDPYCGSALASNFDNIVRKWSKIIGHYPKAAELFLDGKGGTVMDWIAGLQALWPVLMAVYHHHLARDIEVRDGRVFRRDGAQRPVDPVMPPMDDYNYSAT